MNFRKVNNITGWAVFLIAMITYMLTREARGSLWDCGEFVSSAYKMQLPHPPGAPLFTLLGRFFIVLFGDNPNTAANAVNFMSAMASAATILFLFWTITHFARKMFVSVGEQLTGQQIFTVMAAGVVGGLAYTFSDSFWFSAVEGEVYALSSFFTALVFWAILKWEHADEHAGNDAAARVRSDRWIIFLFFMMGLSIGVHLLNLLSIPAIIMVYYFRRHYKAEAFKSDAARFIKDKILIWDAIITIGIIILIAIVNSSGEEDLTGLALIFGFLGVIVALVRIYASYKAIRSAVSAFIIGCLITGVVMVAVIQYSMKAAGMFDVFFVNSLHLPFFSGFAIYFLALAAVIGWAFTFTEKNNSRTRFIIWFVLFVGLSALPFFLGAGSEMAKLGKFILTAGLAGLAGYFFKATALRILKLSLWCYAFMMLGYFMYFTSMIRSNANPAIDMNNVDNPINLVYYLSREQYGSAPLVYGPHFAAEYEQDPNSYNGIAMKKGEMKYVKTNNRYVPVGTEDEPTYRSEDLQWFPRIWDRSNDQGHADFYSRWLNLPQDQQTRRYKAPTYRDNLEWFFTYQMSLMYWRYFMWNFGGKQNDIQGFGTVRDGNWISGIPLIDNNRLGDQGQMPDSIKKNKAHNKLYMLPFILGIVGCVYQYLKNRRDWIVTFLLFFLTGIAVVFYLNQPGGQPRERDYAYVGSFYAFAVWIGLAVVGFVRMAREKEDKRTFQNQLIYGSALTFVIILMSSLNNGTFGSVFMTSLYITALYAALTLGVTWLLRAISSSGQNWRTINIVSSLLCLAVPLIMAQQEWDDHDRSRKTLAPDLAKDYLESCAPNAIIFTFGDNDTYPLWYAQEVEKVRPDIRIINNSLLGIDWYVNQLRYKVNQSDSLDVIFTPEQIENHNREFLSYRAKGDQARYYNLYDILKKEVGKPVIDETSGRDVGGAAFPVSRVGVAVDEATVRANGTVMPGDSIVSPMLFEIPQRTLQRGLYRSDLIILSIIASNQWKRPIYFTSPYGELGLYGYLRKDGLAYRLVPVQNKYPQSNWIIEQKISAIEQSIGSSLGGTQIGDNNDSVMYNNLMDKYAFGGASRPGVYFDEENRRHLLNIRSVFAEAAGNEADKGNKDKAGKLLDKLDKGILPDDLPYALVSRFSSHNQTSLIYLEACYKAGKLDQAEKIRKALRKDIDDQTKYYQYLKTSRPELFTGQMQGGEVFYNDVVMKGVLDSIEHHYSPQLRPNVPAEVTLPTIQSHPPDTVKPDTGRKR